ncbi:transglutaminase-like domain-containing protein [Noviherbaspirillum sp. Root189]|uniref:transglutaminase-like domain-containing protein n=1 Tax=Noviherbaspirillum sp. Root189 TaxID=1736487 RepID=UPI0009E66499|nr:transglutaminase family protein [Noviherbaspirillum sp. Root189]
MHVSDLPSPPPGMMLVRTGCVLTYEASEAISLLLLIRPRRGPEQTVLQELMDTSSVLPLEELGDSHGNAVVRTTLLPGTTRFRHDALFLVSSQPHGGKPAATSRTPVAQLPADALRYTFASRYCESDRLAGFAASEFGHITDGAELAQAICEWTYRNIEYRYGSGSALLSACDVIGRRYGVCRDFAHVMIALCRALDMPARYVAGHMPYFGVPEADIGVDFHAYCEVYFGGQWHVFDPRHNKPHPARIKIAHGMDAVDAAFATIYGNARLVDLQVWAYEVTGTGEQPGDAVTVVRGNDGSAIKLMPA